jgi:hypothetical protein
MKARFVYDYKNHPLYGEWVEVNQDNMLRPNEGHLANVDHVQFQNNNGSTGRSPLNVALARLARNLHGVSRDDTDDVVDHFLAAYNIDMTLTVDGKWDAPEELRP